jgi:hypothetical protein
MRSAILTIDDLIWAKENAPDLVEECFAQVTILEDLEEYLAWLSESETTTTVVSKLKRYKGRSLAIHPSSACKKGVCLLKLFYECTGKIPAKRAYNDVMQRTWDIGTLLHDSFQAHFKNMYGDRFKDEVRIKNDDLHVVSNADGIFTFTKVRIILELKSIKEGGNYGWEKVQKKPMEDNVRQAYFYMYLTNVPFAIIFYMNKNAGKLKEHPVMFDFDVWDEIQTETIEPVVEAAFNGGEMVEGTAGYHCRNCDFNHSCPAARQERTYAKGSNRPWGRR